MRRSPLFSAIVLAGVSLTQGIAACGGREEPSDPLAGDDASTEPDARASSSGFVPAEAGPPKEAEPTDAGTCPDGSDRPTPPCAYIK